MEAHFILRDEVSENAYQSGVKMEEQSGLICPASVRPEGRARGFFSFFLLQSTSRCRYRYRQYNII